MEAARWREGEEEEGDGLKVRGHAVIGMLHCGVAVRNKWHSPILWMLLQQQWKQQQQVLLREAVSPFHFRGASRIREDSLPSVLLLRGDHPLCREVLHRSSAPLLPHDSLVCSSPPLPVSPFSPEPR